MTKLKHQRKFVITMSAASAVFLVWLFGLKLPLSRDYDRASTEFERLKTSNAEIRSLQTRLGALVEHRDKSMKNYQAILRMIPETGNFSESVGAVSALASEHNLKTMLFNPSGIPIEAEKLVPVGELSNVLVEKYPIDVSLEGDYRDFGFFLDDLKKLPYVYAIKNLKIQPALSGKSLKLDMVIYAYLQREAG